MLKTLQMSLTFFVILMVFTATANCDKIGMICDEFAGKASTGDLEEGMAVHLVNYFCEKRKDSNNNNKKHAKDRQNIEQKWGEHVKDDFAIFAEQLFAGLRNKFLLGNDIFIESLAKLEPMKEGFYAKSDNDSIVLRTSDAKFVFKSLREPFEPKAVENGIAHYAEHMARSAEHSLLARFCLIFRINLADGGKVAFVLMQNAFSAPENGAKLLKFNLTGTFSGTDSAVQHEQKMDWYKQKYGPGPYPHLDTVYREFDFLGLAEKEVDGFFPDGIELESRDEHNKFADLIQTDVEYLLENNLNGYSLLVGVEFVEDDGVTSKKQEVNPQPEIMHNAKPSNYYHAKCNQCKSSPNSPYLKEQKLNVYMTIGDILTPFDAEREEHDVRQLRKRRAHEFEPWLKRLQQLNGVQMETITPLPPLEYAQRFMGAITGCMLRWTQDATQHLKKPVELKQKKFLENIRRGLISTICASFGAQRHIPELTTHREEEKNPHWMREAKYRHEFVAEGGKFKLRNYAFGVFKEIMEQKWEDARAYDLLESLSKKELGLAQDFGNPFGVDIVIGDKFLANFLPRSQKHEGIVPKTFPLDYFQHHLEDYFHQFSPKHKYYALFGYLIDDAGPLYYYITDLPKGFFGELIDNIKSGFIF